MLPEQRKHLDRFAIGVTDSTANDDRSSGVGGSLLVPAYTSTLNTYTGKRVHCSKRRREGSGLDF